MRAGTGGSSGFGVCQITFSPLSYQLTQRDFSPYSARMEAELKSLEQKLTQVVALCQRLRSDNVELRQQLASALDANRSLSAKIGTASERIEALLTQLPEDDA